MSDLIKEIEKRKTFGIIAHPDAGKTTLTEKLLLFGGAIQEAGAVKSNKIKTVSYTHLDVYKRQVLNCSNILLSFSKNILISLI